MPKKLQKVNGGRHIYANIHTYPYINDNLDEKMTFSIRSSHFCSKHFTQFSVKPAISTLV